MECDGSFLGHMCAQGDVVSSSSLRNHGVRFWSVNGGDGRCHWPRTLSVFKRHEVRRLWLVPHGIHVHKETSTLGHDLSLFLFLCVQRKLLGLNRRDVGLVGSSLRTATAGGVPSTVF